MQTAAPAALSPPRSISLRRARDEYSNLEIDHCTGPRRRRARTEAIADLVEQAPQPVAIGVFPGGESLFANNYWVHTLRGGRVEGEVDDSEVAVFSFPTSAASFEVKQEIRRRVREREKSKKLAKLNKLNKLKRFTKPAAAAAE
jgi:hypothetical protein